MCLFLEQLTLEVLQQNSNNTINKNIVSTTTVGTEHDTSQNSSNDKAALILIMQANALELQSLKRLMHVSNGVDDDSTSISCVVKVLSMLQESLVDSYSKPSNEPSYTGNIVYMQQVS
jgi:hypothetical protein